MVKYLMKPASHPKARKGQGIVEYAGAMVIAATLVAAVIALGPDGMATMLDSVYTAINGFFAGEIAAL